MQRILIIDDDRDMCLLLNRFLTRNGFEVVEKYKGKTALEYVSQNNVDLILCDYRLEDMNGRDVMIGLNKIKPSIPVIIITGYSDVKAAVEVTKLGAVDYVTKPLLPNEILLTIKKSLEAKPDESTSSSKSRSEKAKSSPNKDSKIKLATGEYIFGNSQSFKDILKQIERVAPTNFSVIIYGETGCGKEVIAQTIHQNSMRAGKPFIAIDCGALSKELSNSELFGHEKGSFTGAIGQKIGNMELANGGTIFLDEVSNLSYDTQVSLLRVVQERKIRRVGGDRDIEIDVRIIVASNERLLDAAKKGKFREDLFHRFNEFSIEVEPLRRRKEDILLFGQHFLEQTSRELQKNVTNISDSVQQIFLEYSWPGNLRELRNVIKRSVLLTDTESIETNVLPFEIVNFNKLQFESAPASAPAATDQDGTPYDAPPQEKPVPVEINYKSLKSASANAEYNMIVEALKKANYNKSKAAKILSIDRKTLYNKMKEHELMNAG